MRDGEPEEHSLTGTDGARLTALGAGRMLGLDPVWIPTARKPSAFTGADFIGDLSKAPMFGKVGDPLAEIRGCHHHVVVEVSNAETAPPTWTSGFYRAGLTPGEADERLRR